MPIRTIYRVGDLVKFRPPRLFHSSTQRYKNPGIIVEVKYKELNYHYNLTGGKLSIKVRWADGKHTYEYEHYLEKISAVSSGGATNYEQQIGDNIMILKKGSFGADVRKLQEALNELEYNCGWVDGHFGGATELQVENFQQDNELLPDGVVGRQTLVAINENLKESGLDNLCFDLGSAEPEPEMPSEKFSWVRVDADKVNDSQGYSYFNLREDAAEAFEAFRAEVNALGGVVTSAGARRLLSDSKKSKSRSTKSLHYTGLAFDMAIDTGMGDPRKQNYVIESIGDRKWNVWCKTENPSVPEVTVEGWTYHHNKYFITGRMFSLTEIAQKHGFEPIKARRYFMNGGHYLGAEWWHFQYEKALIPSVSTFGGELLKIYSLDECKEFAYWEESKNSVWQVDWF